MPSQNTRPELCDTGLYRSLLPPLGLGPKCRRSPSADAHSRSRDTLPPAPRPSHPPPAPARAEGARGFPPAAARLLPPVMHRAKGNNPVTHVHPATEERLGAVIVVAPAVATRLFVPLHCLQVSHPFPAFRAKPSVSHNFPLEQTFVCIHRDILPIPAGEDTDLGKGFRRRKKKGLGSVSSISSFVRVT